MSGCASCGGGRSFAQPAGSSSQPAPPAPGSVIAAKPLANAVVVEVVKQ